MSDEAAGPGHVFIIQGDIHHLACDAYLLSADRELRPTDRWAQVIPDATDRLDAHERAAFEAERTFAIAARVQDSQSSEPTPIITAVPFHGVVEADDLRERLQHFFRVASEVLAERTATPDGRRLVALPFFGTGAGGGGPVRGAILRVLYEEARHASGTYRFDIALVVRERRAYDLAQTIRRAQANAWEELGTDLLAAATALGQESSRHRLVPFIGAGVSVSAGAPTWRGLVQELARKVDLSNQEAAALASEYDVMDQAAYLYREYQRVHEGDQLAFARAIVDAVDRQRYGLAPALLASLEAEQAITLNYDTLFERAAHDAGLDRRVIPGPATDDERWLLKLHGTVDDLSSIVLTRDHYLRFNADRDALAALAKATLMTRHLLFVGFGMTDSHFHEIAHEVRRALPSDRGDVKAGFGTVLSLTADPVTERLWEGELDFIVLGSSRRLEIFLDAVLAHASNGHSYILSRGYASTLPPSDEALREAVNTFLRTIDPRAYDSVAWPILADALKELGWNER